MKPGIVLAIAGLLLAAWPQFEARAAEVRVVDRPECYLVLSGEIAPGDADKLEKLLAVMEDDESVTGDRARSLCLNSPGGSLSEGIKLAKLVFSSHLPTYVDKNEVCNSACSLVWLGGSEFEDSHYASRKLNALGKLGFHAPYIPIREGEYTNADVEKGFRLGVRAIAMLMEIPFTDGLGGYQTDIVPRALLPEMLQKEPNEFASVDKIEDALVWGIDMVGMSDPPFDRNATLCNICRNYETAESQIRGNERTCEDAKQSVKGNKVTFSLDAFDSEGTSICHVKGMLTNGRLHATLLQMAPYDETPKASDYASVKSWYGYDAQTSIASVAGKSLDTDSDGDPPPVADTPAPETTTPQASLEIEKPKGTPRKDTGFQKFNNTDIAGKVISSMKGGSLDACLAGCGSDDQCLAYTYDRWNRWCFMKSAATGRSVSAKAVSGVRTSLKTPPSASARVEIRRYRGKAFPGRGYRSAATGSSQACEAICGSDAQCTAYTYREKGGKCELYKSADEYQSDSAALSGAKFQAE